jgi:hypothetical protein
MGRSPNCLASASMAQQPVAPFFEPGAPPAPLPLLTCQTLLSNNPSPKPTITVSESLSILSRTKPSLHGSRRVRSASHARSPLPYIKPAGKAKKVAFGSLSGSDVAWSQSPEPELSELSDLSSQRSPSDFSSDSDGGLIHKPPGEVGRPNSGGYSLEKTLNWDRKLYAKLQVNFTSFPYELISSKLNSLEICPQAC